MKDQDNLIKMGNRCSYVYALVSTSFPYKGVINFIIIFRLTKMKISNP